MTVGDIRERMGNAEFVRWSVYYQRIAQREELASRLRGSHG